jgi:hypothetical protein
MKLGSHLVRQKMIDSVFRGVAWLLLSASMFFIGMDFLSLASSSHPYFPRTLFDYFLNLEPLSLADYFLKRFALILPAFILAGIYVKSKPIVGLVWSIITLALTLSNALVLYLMA